MVLILDISGPIGQTKLGGVYVSQVLAGSGNAVFVPKTHDEAARLVREGYRYLLADVALDAMRYSPALRQQFEVAQVLLADRAPVASFPNPRGRFLQPKFEMNIRFRGSLDFIRTASERGSNEIRIYDLMQPTTKAMLR